MAKAVAIAFQRLLMVLTALSLNQQSLDHRMSEQAPSGSLQELHALQEEQASIGRHVTDGLQPPATADVPPFA
jgi:hypothetical protein